MILLLFSKFNFFDIFKSPPLRPGLSVTPCIDQSLVSHDITMQIANSSRYRRIQVHDDHDSASLLDEFQCAAGYFDALLGVISLPPFICHTDASNFGASYPAVRVSDFTIETAGYSMRQIARYRSLWIKFKVLEIKSDQKIGKNRSVQRQKVVKNRFVSFIKKSFKK